MQHHYRIYGLQVRSNRQLSLLHAQDPAPPDLVVTWTSDKTRSPDGRLDWERVMTADLRQRNDVAFWRAATAEGVFTKLRYTTAKAHLDFLLDPRQQELWVLYSEEDAEIDLQSYFVGPALGCILRLRSIVCLHSSVVKIDDRAIAILGKKGSGKSTSAAALAQLGALVLSDDLAVLSPLDQGFLVQPGYPQVRLWPSSIQALYPGSGPLPRVIAHLEKRYVQLADGGEPGATFWSRPLPLAAIYVLAETKNGHATPHIETVVPTDKLMSLVANTYGSYVVMEELRQREFVLLAQLTKTVPVRRLVCGQDLISLPVQSKAILDDFRRHNFTPARSQNEFLRRHPPSETSDEACFSEAG